jgi:long-chain acyl-CoA synthetase
VTAVSGTRALADAGPTTLPGLLVERARRTPGDLALRKKALGRWKTYDWSTYADRVARIASGLDQLGVRAGDRVAIHAGNRPAWVFTDLAVQALGAISVGIYPTSPAHDVAYLLAHSGAAVLVAEDEEQVDKALEVRDEVPALRRIVVIDPRGVDVDADDLLMTLAELEASGASADVDELAHRVASVDPATAALIVYTSGTTGPPKGAMISHDALLAAAQASEAQFAVGPSDEVLSYLPLCHIAERLLSVIDAVGAGYVVNFGEGGDSFTSDLREVQPTLFLGVPRVWEKMMAGITIRMMDASFLKRRTYRFWTTRGARIARRRMAGRLGPVDRLTYLIGWIVLYRPLRKKLGLLHVREPISGAAPIAPQVLEFFWAIGVPVREGYGQTENTAQATITPRDDVRIGTVGRAVPGTEVRLAPDGEILTRGPATFLGYLDDPEATAAAFDDGWLRTGDIGRLDDDGYLTITDRKKDIIITAGGKNIAPSEIENRLKLSPYVREAVVVGDRRRHLTALIGIEADTVGDWATRANLPYTTYEDLASKPEVVDLVTSWVDEVNADLPQVETIKAFRLLPKELDEQDGEVTATQKVKRAAIAAEFADLIEAMYGGAPPLEEATS